MSQILKKASGLRLWRFYNYTLKFLNSFSSKDCSYSGVSCYKVVKLDVKNYWVKIEGSICLVDNYEVINYYVVRSEDLLDYLSS